jgi:hypothetical protein
MQVLSPVRVQSRYRIAKFELVSFNLNKKKPAKLSAFSVMPFEFNFEFNGDELKRKHCIYTFITLKVFNDKKKKFLLCEMVTKGKFEITNYDQSLKLLGDFIPSDMLSTMYVYHIANMNGAFTILIKETFLDGAILPSVAPDDIRFSAPAPK